MECPVNSKQRLIDMIRNAQPASMGSSLLRLARLAEAAHRFEQAKQLRQQHASGSDASGRFEEADSRSACADKEVSATLPPLSEPSSFYTEVER